MAEEQLNKPQEISKELFGSKLEIKKIFQTFIQVFKNVKEVVDDFYTNTGNYTRPVKYALSIIAPYVIIIQIFNIDMAHYILEANSQSARAQVEANPELGPFYDRYFEVLSYFVKIMYEFLPVVYAAIFIPIFAFWLKKFFKQKELKYSYYYALGTYIMMSATTITLLMFFVSISGLYTVMDMMQVSLLFTLLFYTYGIINTFQEGILKSIIKTILVLGLTFITFIIPMVIALMSITLATL